MDLVESTTDPARSAANDLRGTIRGSILLPTDAAYERARLVWNGAVTHRPALIVQCQTSGDVQAAVLAARAHGLPLSVRGGGHDWAGRSLRHDGLVIDLSAMRHVAVEPDARAATVAGGATVKEVIAAAAPHGLVAVTGNCGTVGMAGLTLGGGYGLLSSRYGLAADNLLGAEIVLADGRCVTVSAGEYPDLFWALCGGGGNFGVVTSLRIRLHPMRELLAGLILFPLSDARSVLLEYASEMASAPDDLAVMAGILPAPDGSPAVFLAPAWTGAPDHGTSVIANLQRLGTPMLTQVQQMSYGDLLNRFDAQIVTGRHYAIHTRWLADLTPDVVFNIVTAVRNTTSGVSIIVLHHCHGAAARIAPAATAFGLRRDHFLLEIVAAWEPAAGEDGAIHSQWARDLSQAVARDALPGGYPNLLGPEEHEQIPFAHGDNADRLRDIKGHFDPDGVFSAIPLGS